VLVYTTVDYLWWVLIAYLMIRLLKSENPRWWLGIGAVIGLGMQTKYSIVFLIAGIVAGVILTQAHRYLLSPWLWAGVLLAVLIFLPNLAWQAQHDFISLDFLSSIHARDIRIGRTETFLKDQTYISANLVTIPLWILGLGFYFFAPSGRRFRTLGWMFVIPFALLYESKGRGYYLAPAYPMLLAAGAVWLGQGIKSIIYLESSFRTGVFLDHPGDRFCRIQLVSLTTCSGKFILVEKGCRYQHRIQGRDRLARSGRDGGQDICCPARRRAGRNRILTATTARQGRSTCMARLTGCRRPSVG